MDIQLTEKEQKIYDDLVEYSSGEYRDTEFDISVSAFGKTGFAGNFGDFCSWHSINGDLIRVLSGGCHSLCIENWREKIKDDLLEDFVYEYRLGTIKYFDSTIKYFDSMVEFTDWKNKISNDGCIETSVEGNAFYKEIVKWGEGDKEKVKLLVKNGIRNNPSWDDLVKYEGTMDVQFSALDGKFNIEVDIYNLLIQSIQYSSSNSDNGDSPRQKVFATFNFLDAVGFYDKYLNANTFDEFLVKLKCIKGAGIKSIEYGGWIFTEWSGDYRTTGLFDFLSKLYTGMQRYGSPENYLKQIAASREVD
jgi:hypothetical protein